LKELEVLKLQHLEVFVVKIRQELKTWWDNCYYGAAQRQQFKPFYSDDFSEALLDQHERELDKIKKHYNENSHLFAMVTFWTANNF
jgi:protein regulator of cytokinesis 1